MLTELTEVDLGHNQEVDEGKANNGNFTFPRGPVLDPEIDAVDHEDPESIDRAIVKETTRTAEARIKLVKQQALVRDSRERLRKAEKQEKSKILK